MKVYSNSVFIGPLDQNLANGIPFDYDLFNVEFWYNLAYSIKFPNNEPVHIPEIPNQFNVPNPKELRSRLLTYCKEFHYTPIIISNNKSKYRGEGFTAVSPGTVFEFVEPRVKRFERAFVIGDIHGEYDKLVDLLKLSRDYPIVFVGDLVDRGPKQDEVLDLVFRLVSDNSNKAAITPGNHDTSYKYRLGMDEEYRTQERADKLDKILEFRCDWVEGPDWIVTHSPCHQKYLKKNDEKSLQKSINFRRASQGLHTVEQIEEKMKEWGGGNVRHIFGHQRFNEPWIYKNMIGIDTGACSGGKLTGYFTDTKEFVQI